MEHEAILDSAVDWKNELDWIREAQQGNKEAMMALCDKYNPLVQSTVRRYPAAWRDDLASQAHLSLLLAIRRFNPDVGTPFAAFAKAMVRGGVKSAARPEIRYQDSRMLSAQSKDDEHSLDWNEVLEDSGSAKEYESAEWRLCLAAIPLSPRERMAVEGALEGRGIAEIAQAEGVSVETVKTWRKRAWKKAREALCEA